MASIYNYEVNIIKHLVVSLIYSHAKFEKLMIAASYYNGVIYRDEMTVVLALSLSYIFSKLLTDADCLTPDLAI